MRRWSFGPWLWSAPLDLGLFGGSAAIAFLLLLCARPAGWVQPGEFPEWSFIACILAVDVAHVYSTLFRTYFDGEEWRARPYRYLGLPLFLYVGGVVLYARAPLAFWSTLAYLALFHFIRQQVGWVALYRARGAGAARWDAWLDASCVYMATLYPVAHWHVHLAETRFSWFVAGDFVTIFGGLEPWLPALQLLWAFCLLAFLARQLQLAFWKRTVYVGKNLVVATTAGLWYGGIVATNDDFDFTVTNVLAHGIPYMGLLWVYARARALEKPAAFNARIVAGGLAAFLCVLWLLAFLEEALWDRLVWHDHVWLFGQGGAGLSGASLTWLVPLLALPQATHYALDGLLWRRQDTRRLPAQRRAFGFR